MEAGLWVDKRDRQSRRVRWEELDDDLTYTPNQLDRDVVAEDQIRTVIRTFKERLFTEIFPGRTEVPKTLIFAKDDSHADDIVRIVREEFGKGNEFCEKITYRTSTARIVDPVTGAITYKNTGIKPEDLLSSFRNSYNPRIAVTVDMIATGTDVRPLEIVFFMRDVKSANYFEQMKGRGSRVDLARRTASRHPGRDGQDALRDRGRRGRLRAGACGRAVAGAQAVRVAQELLQGRRHGRHRAGRRLHAGRPPGAARPADDAPRSAASLDEATGQPLPALIGALAASVDPDVQEARAQERFRSEDPTPEQIAEVGEEARLAATAPFLPSAVRERIVDIQQDNEQIVDRVSQDAVLFAGVSEAAKEKAQGDLESFAAYLEQHRDEITALQLLYSRPHGQGPTLKQLKELADDAPSARRVGWTPDGLWQAYQMIERTKVRGRGAARPAADLVSLVRFALQQEPVLAPFAETVNDRFARLAGRAGRRRAWSSRRSRAVAGNGA